MNVTKNQRNFEIVAHSFGSLIAIELMRRLEGMNLSGRLFLIDGSPELMKAMKGQTDDSEEKQQTLFLSYVMNLFVPLVTSEVCWHLFLIN